MDTIQFSFWFWGVGIGVGFAAIGVTVYLVHRKVKQWKKDSEDLQSEREKTTRLEEQLRDRRSAIQRLQRQNDEKAEEIERLERANLDLSEKLAAMREGNRLLAEDLDKALGAGAPVECLKQANVAFSKFLDAQAQKDAEFARVTGSIVQDLQTRLDRAADQLTALNAFLQVFAFRAGFMAGLVHEGDGSPVRRGVLRKNIEPVVEQWQHYENLVLGAAPFHGKAATSAITD